MATATATATTTAHNGELIVPVTEHRGKLRVVVAVLVSVMLLFNGVCKLAGTALPFLSGFGDMLVLVMIPLTLLCCLPRIRLHYGMLALVAISYAAMLVSLFRFEFSPVIIALLIQFFVWGLYASLLTMQDYDLKTVLDVSLVISAIVLAADLVTPRGPDYDNMVWTYGVFPCIVTVFAHLFFCRKTSARWLWIFYLPGFLILLKFLADSNRGGYISLVALIYLLTAKRVNAGNKTLKTRVIWNVVLLAAVVAAVAFYAQIIEWLFYTLRRNDVEVYAVTKMYAGILEDNITNNRAGLYQAAWQGFLQSPLIGHGIGSFHIHFNEWTHNFLLQLLYEGGLFLFSIIVIPLARISWFFLTDKTVTNEEYAMFVICFATSVPKLLVSTELWLSPAFWMLLTCGLTRTYRRKKSIAPVGLARPDEEPAPAQNPAKFTAKSSQNRPNNAPEKAIEKTPDKIPEQAPAAPALAEGKPRPVQRFRRNAAREIDR